MKITIKVKQVGKKYALLENKIIEIDDVGETPLLKDFLTVVVRQQVSEFNSKVQQKNLLLVFSKTDVEQKASTGKVSFGRVFNDKKVDANEAIEIALLAFEDGLFSVFNGDEEIKKLDDKIDLRKNKEITFIRLTFLAGSYW